MRVMARVFLARTLWLQGLADQAVSAVQRSVEDARMANHANSVGYALGFGACLIALWVGDLVEADNYATMLVDHSTSHGLPIWLAFGRSYQAVLAIRCGDVVTGLPLLCAGLKELGDGTTTARFMAVHLAETLAREGRIDEGIAMIEETTGPCERGEERWASAELLRISGELRLLRGGIEDVEKAEDFFRQSIDLARRQDALSWEFRGSTSLTLLLRGHGRSAEAAEPPQSVYHRFTHV